MRAFSYFHHLANAAEDLHARARAAGGGDHRRGAGAAARRPRADQEDHLVLRARARRAGADRAPDGGAAQEHPRSPSRRHRSAGGARRREPAEDVERALRREVLAAVEDQRAARCPSRPSPTRSRTASPTFVRPSWTRSRACTPRSRTACGPGTRLAPFLRVASWIGGDRDGNPHVTAEVTEHAAERQASVAFAHYLARDPRAGRRAVAVVALHRGVARAARRWRRARPIAAPAATRSRTGARWSASTRASRRRRARWASTPARWAPPPRRRARTRGPDELVGRSGRDRDRAGRRRRGAGRRRPAAQPARAPSTCSGFTCARSTCASTAGSTSASSRELLARAHRHARLRDAGRAGAPGAAAARAVDAAAAGLAARRATARRPRRRWRRWRRPRACAPASASARSRTTSSR